MTENKKCIILVKKIKEIYREGLRLSDDVLHYIDSTFLNPSIQDLKEIIMDDKNCEKDPLIELIFFPDESIQIKLEDFLESHTFKKKDEKTIREHLLSQKIETIIHFPWKKNALKLAMPRSAANQFITRLNITKKLDKRLSDTVNNYVGEKLRNLCKVKLRNSRIDFTENKILFICSIFEKIKAESRDFFECLDFALHFSDELSDGLSDELLARNDIYQALKDKKLFYFKNLQKTKQFEEKMKKYNMETLIMQGVKVPFMSVEDAQKKIVVIDRISIAVFGKTA